MADQDIAQRVESFIMSEIAGAPIEGGLAPDFPIIENGVVDSLGLFKLVAFMEDEYQVSIAPEEIVFENFATINDITGLIRDKMAPTGSA